MPSSDDEGVRPRRRTAVPRGRRMRRQADAPDNSRTESSSVRAMSLSPAARSSAASSMQPSHSAALPGREAPHIAPDRQPPGIGNRRKRRCIPLWREVGRHIVPAGEFISAARATGGAFSISAPTPREPAAPVDPTPRYPRAEPFSQPASRWGPMPHSLGVTSHGTSCRRVLDAQSFHMIGLSASST